jgi:CheY-like chemotaxis protein
MKVLVVDDEVKIRAVIKEYAEFEGYEIDEAADGMEAIAKCRATDYDIIIMDIIFLLL